MKSPDSASASSPDAHRFSVRSGSGAYKKAERPANFQGLAGGEGFTSVTNRAKKLEADRKALDKTVGDIEEGRKKTAFTEVERKRNQRRLADEAQREVIEDLSSIRRKIREADEDVSLESLAKKMSRPLVEDIDPPDMMTGKVSVLTGKPIGARIEGMDPPDMLSGRMDVLKRAEIPQPAIQLPKNKWEQKWQSFKSFFWGKRG